MLATPAPRNRSLRLAEGEQALYTARCATVSDSTSLTAVLNRVILGDMQQVVPLLRGRLVDLLFLDSPYNLTKTFGEARFSSMTRDSYAEWMDGWLRPILPLLKPDASIYICGDWRSSSAIEIVAERYFRIRNRITWEREKGRGARANWKNASEDVWFCTAGEDYRFDPDAVQLRRTVKAPYTSSGEPKDWRRTQDGAVRDTGASNLWTDLSVPFWSMPENTEHPTQKPEKLLAKAILASSSPGDLVFDPFLGSGTAAVVARKLGRDFVGIEVDKRFAAIAVKRLDAAQSDTTIQGYSDGVFWERNSAPVRRPVGPRQPRLSL